MSSSFNIQQTRPYLSLLLLKLNGKSAKGAESRVRDAIAEELGVTEGNPHRTMRHVGNSNKGDLRIAHLQYLERKSPSWLLLDDPEVVDESNQLVLVCRKKRFVGVYCSDSSVKAVILKSMREGGNSAFDEVSPVSRELLDTAFMGGRARTLWLSGIHRRTAVKADSKILSGISLQNALNPLDDQSYHYTAARSVTKLQNGERPIGIAHAKSSLWLSTTKNWGEFAKLTTSILESIHEADSSGKASNYLMPFLAEPVTDASDLGEPFEISFVPPELLTFGMGEENLEDKKIAEKWAYGCEFSDVRYEEGAILAVSSLYGRKLGLVELRVTGTGSKLKITACGNSEADTSEEEWSALMKACSNARWLKVRFDSGKVLSDGNYYQMQFRDHPFTGWKFIDLSEGKPKGFDPKKEKPTDASNKYHPSLIGNGNSLFCWVRRNWFGLPGFGSAHGFLFCDDGANEIADFIHLDLKPDDDMQPRLSLIHVKGSKNGKPDRNISVSDYEVVCGQAVKNLRALEGTILKEIAESGKNKDVAKATWQNGKLVGNRKTLINALDCLGSNYRRRVIILQPCVTKSAHDKGGKLLAANSKKMEVNRLRQLNTLLLETEMGCRALGADFHVFGASV